MPLPSHLVSKMFPTTKCVAVSREMAKIMRQSKPYCKNSTGTGSMVAINGPMLGIKFSTNVRTANIDASSVPTKDKISHVSKAASRDTKILIIR